MRIALLHINPTAGDLEGNAALIVRDWHRILKHRVTADGACGECGASIPGEFAAFERAFGPRRIPLRLMREDTRSAF